MSSPRKRSGGVALLLPSEATKKRKDSSLLQYFETQTNPQNTKKRGPLQGYFQPAQISSDRIKESAFPLELLVYIFSFLSGWLCGFMFC
jgi:hypothetical protein